MRVRIQFFILPYLSDDPLVISPAAFTSVLLFFCCTLPPNRPTIFLLYITPKLLHYPLQKISLGTRLNESTAESVARFSSKIMNKFLNFHAGVFIQM
jgi:hypothetical protein